MVYVHRYLFPLMWLGWAAYWLLLSRDVKATARSEPLLSRMLHLVPLALALALLWLPGVPLPLLEDRFLPRSAWTFWIGAAATLSGLLFSVWARIFLGKNWSAMVTLKHGHELITGGPYRIVRHPIYTGLLAAFIGSAIALGKWRGVLAVGLALFAFLRKLQLEERWMRETFGEAYAEYSRHVAALIPMLL